jgi:hypothetical protein
MRTALFSAHLMTEHKRKAQASIGAFFSGATNSAAASNKVPRTASSGGKKSEWLKRGEPLSVMVRTRGKLVGDPLETSSSTRVAAFDFDSTLVETRTGSPFARDADDWRVFNEHVQPKLKQLHAEGYRCDRCPALPA